jgi:CDP-diacylglycerol--serine O-phosphatidyltransferase
VLLKLKKPRRLLEPVPITKLIPNILTLIGLVIGVSSVRFALDSKWEMAVYCVLIATIIDGLDGKIARMLNATSHFGAELDSLCDFVNFGLCPALLIYLWSFQQYEYKVISWASIMFFIVCMGIKARRI